MNSTPKTIHYPIWNPRINSGVLMGNNAIDQASYAVALAAEGWSN